ncbi:hypothetical protein Agub_g3645 [Astrephomene gubernaculifera]|uniref:Guanylate cyclase domain-containing protein n=1 Tax=Astrephomene gubernaculifera TaxID=47775 RepID=A0AAD3HJ53_9CHLO|nr:hypothetical protein Agub_g3645 [Astrephomene gubernaculifera]
MDWFFQCFRKKHGGVIYACSEEQQALPVPRACNAQQRTASQQNAFIEQDHVGEALLVTMNAEVEDVGQNEGPAVASLEEARQLIRVLNTRLRELEGSAAAESLLQSTIASLPADKAGQTLSPAHHKTGNDMGKIMESDQIIDADGDRRANEDPHHREPHTFRVYEKKELIDTLRSRDKPAAAVLLQAVCEEDLPNVSPALLLDVDPAVGEAVAGAPELMASIHSGRSVADLACMEHLPPYLRLRLYMVQASAARPILAHANTAARTLFEARSDRQLQWVLEAQVQQDAMLAMLLQEILDELLTAPVSRCSGPLDPTCSESDGAMTLHSLSHFANTNNPKVFPFVPVTMRGCGYRKTSGEVVPCVLMEFAPDSNQGAFLEHLQRDYTMMGRMSSIVTLFTLKGDVLHQNAGSIAYFGYQRSGSSRKRTSAHNASARPIKRPGGLMAALHGSFMAGSGVDERPVLTQLFQLAPPDTLEGMLESMVQGGVWRSILPVPPSLATMSRPLAPLVNANAPSYSSVPVEPESLFTADTNAFMAVDAGRVSASLGNVQRSMMSHYGKADPSEGSFALGKSRSPGSRALNVVPEQSQEVQHVSSAARTARLGVLSTSGQAEKQMAALVRMDGTAEVLPGPATNGSSPRVSMRTARAVRRSTTYSAIPTPPVPGAAAAEGGSNSFTACGTGNSAMSTGGTGARLARMRRRSLFPMGMDGSIGYALCQSTWGLLGGSAAAFEVSRNSGRIPNSECEQGAAGPAQNGTQTFHRRSAVAALEAHAAAAAAASSRLGSAREGVASGAPSGAVQLQADTNSNTLLSLPPSQSQSQAFPLEPSQNPPWQIRSSQVQAAFQSQASTMSQHTGTQPQAPLVPPPGWLLQDLNCSPSSESPGFQSLHMEMRMRSLLPVMEAQRSLTDEQQQQQLQACPSIPGQLLTGGADGMVEAVGSATSPCQVILPTPSATSASSLVSPQVSVYQHGDYSIGNATSGSLRQNAAGAVLAAAFANPSRQASFYPPAPSSATQMQLQRARSSSMMSNPQGPSSLGAGVSSSPNNVAVLGAPTNSGSGARAVRRKPMRQSERRIPNLLPAKQSSLSQVQALQPSPLQPQPQPPLPLPMPSLSSQACKSATSFSFGSKTHNRPLVRMMSFLNAAPQTQGHMASMSQPCHGFLPYHGAPAEGLSRIGSGRHGGAEGAQGGLASAGLPRYGSPNSLNPNQVSGAASRRPPSALPRCSSLLPSPSDPEGPSALSLTPKRGLPQELVLAPPPVADGDDGRLYHEITATPFLDPVSKAQVVMIVQTDVTARVRLERRLAEVMAAEHKLLENIFPRHVLEHIATSAAVDTSSFSQFNLSMLNAMPDPTKTATDHEQVTILFADIVGFTSMCKEVPAKTVMKFLNDLYTRFDTLLDIYGVYKVETIGDCYMVAGGLISKDADGFAAVRKGSTDNLQAWRVLSFAKAMLRDAQKVLLPTTHEPVKMRVGIHTGPVVSGIVGTRMPRFCLFGDTINTASRMESTCPYGRIQVSATTHALVPGEKWEPTGGVQVKGKGMMDTYLLRWSPSDVVSAALMSASMSVPGPAEGSHGRKHTRAGAVPAGNIPVPCGNGGHGGGGGDGGGGGVGGAEGEVASVDATFGILERERRGSGKVPVAGGGGGAAREPQFRPGSSDSNPTFLFNTMC